MVSGARLDNRIYRESKIITRKIGSDIVTPVGITNEVRVYYCPNPGGDSTYWMGTDDNVLASFGATGLVQTIEKIGRGYTATPVVERDNQGNFQTNRKNLPLDGVKDPKDYTDNQLIGMLLTHVYGQINKVPDNKENGLSKFHAMTSNRVVARFADYSSLVGPSDIIPDYNDLMNIVTISHGCPNKCLYCPERGGIELFTKEQIEENMGTARKTQQEYHGGLEDLMNEGFINTSDILWFKVLEESEMKPEKIIKMFRKYFPELEKIGAFMGVKNILEVSHVPSLDKFVSNYLSDLRAAGLSRAYVGIETGNSEASALLGKNETYEMKKQALRLLGEANFKTKAIVQVGSLGKGFYRRAEDIGKKRNRHNFISSKRALDDTIRLLKESNLHRVMISQSLPLEGLPINKLRKSGRIWGYDDPQKGINWETNYIIRGLRGSGIQVELEYESFVKSKTVNVRKTKKP